MKNKTNCAAGVHERADKGFGPLNQKKIANKILSRNKLYCDRNSWMSLICGLVILWLIFGLSGCVSASTGGQIINGDFETGTLEGWSLVGPDLSTGCGGQHMAIEYSLAWGTFCNRVPIVPQYDGGTFAGYARTGDGIEIGFEQTVSVTTGIPLFYSLDFAVREVQIPGDSRVDQTVSLRLNGDIVASEFFDNPSTEFGHFEGVFIPQSDQVTFTMVSNRPLRYATGFGQIFFDNAELTHVIIPATIDIHPDTLNLKSNGEWITAYIELPEDYNVCDIEVSTINLDSIPVDQSAPATIGDYDSDGISDLMVKFDRAAVVAYLGTEDVTEDGTGTGDYEELTITCELTDGTQFEGSDTIRVMEKGKGK